jgi:hypothetical protein
VQALPAPRQVSVDGHASWENDPSDASRNLQLSQRRRQIAVGTIGDLAAVTGGTFHGHTRAKGATPPRVNDAHDRVAEIRGMVGGVDAVALRATLARPAGGTTPPAGPATPPTGGGSAPGGGTPPAGGGGTTQPKPDGTAPGGTTTPAPAGGGATPAPAGGGTPAPSGAPGMGVGIAFKMQKVKQEELKTIRFRYSRSEAVQQSYAPQGFLGLLAKDLGPGHFIEVDLDDKFFRTLDIVAEAPIDFARIGLLSAQLTLDYGQPTDPAGVKHKDLTFDAAHPKTQQHTFTMNPRLDTSYRLGVEYHFDPASGWDGERFSYTLPAKTTEDRTLLVNPYEHLAFVEVKVVAGDIDWGMVRSTDVRLRYEDPGVFSREKVVTLTEAAPEQTWKLRLTHPEQRTISYSTVHHLVDGSTRQGPPATTTASSIAIDDAFEDALDIEFVPVYDTARIRQVFAEIVYDDTANRYRREQRLEFTGTAAARQRLHIALFDRQRRTYSLAYTLVGNDNSIRRLLPVETTSTLVFVGETFTG